MGDETDRNYENQWDEFFSVWDTETADGASSASKRQKSGELDTVRKGKVQSPTKIRRNKGFTIPNTEPLNMEKSKWDLIPDDELYELNAQELSTIDELIQEYESGEGTFKNLVNVTQNLGFDVVEGHQRKETSTVSSNVPSGQKAYQSNQKQALACSCIGF
jgi:hypothetical protein